MLNKKISIFVFVLAAFFIFAASQTAFSQSNKWGSKNSKTKVYDGHKRSNIHGSKENDHGKHSYQKKRYEGSREHGRDRDRGWGRHRDRDRDHDRGERYERHHRDRDRD